MSGNAENSRQGDRFTVAIQCPRCGQTGEFIWEDDRHAGTASPEPVLIGLSEGFYERIARKSPYRIELVCHACGMAQPQ